MDISISRRGETALVSLAGEVDLGAAPVLRKALLDPVMDRRALVVDLAAVAYIDSSGIAALVEAYQGARANATRLVLAAPSPAVLRVLKLARLDQIFTLAETVEAALARAS